MPNCTADTMSFGRMGRREIEANFTGGALSSDGGLMLLRQVDRRIGLSKAVAAALHDPRNQDMITHDIRDLVAQRLYGLCCGYEDLNDHDVLRRSRIDGARHSAAVIKLLVTRLRQAWPAVRIIIRGDSGFCRQRLIRWCERQNVGYVIGLARNARLHRQVEGWERLMEHQYTESGIKQRLIREFTYAAQTWDCTRRVITRLEFGSQGNNPRFIVTNLEGNPAELYDTLYCQRGEAENRIKETQLDLFGTRASCQRFLANGLRIMFSALAYTLMCRLRELALAGTELAKATAGTLRVKLLKIGAAFVCNTRRIRILLASHHPLRHVYFIAANALASP